MGSTVALDVAGRRDREHEEEEIKVGMINGMPNKVHGYKVL